MMYRRVSDTRIAVVIPDRLQRTLRGLQLVLGRIPQSERALFCAYAWAGEERDDQGRRWGLIDVRLRIN